MTLFYHKNLFSIIYVLCIHQFVHNETIFVFIVYKIFKKKTIKCKKNVRKKLCRNKQNGLQRMGKLWYIIDSVFL